MGYQGPFTSADVVGKTPSPWPAVIGSVVGAGIDAWSQSQTNKANARNVQKQIDFQQQQSETEWQRAVQDMGKAGLNPALAYEKGGNATQAGAASTNQPLMTQTAAKFATALGLWNEMANSAAQRDLVRKNADLTAAQEEKTRRESIILGPQGLLAQDANYQNLYRDLGFSKARGEKFTADKTAETYGATMANLGANTAKTNAEEAESRNKSTLMEQDFMTEQFRKHMAPWLNNSAALLARGQDLKNVLSPFSSGRSETHIYDWRGQK